MATGTITNTLTDPSGTAVANATIYARLKPGPGFRVGTYTEIAQLESTTSDGSGFWTMTLEINTDITPGDSYYEIEELIPGSQEGSRVWSIEVASGSHSLYASLVSIPPVNSPPVAYLTQSVADARYVTGSSVQLANDSIQPVGTATQTGTATVAARADHVHPLSPAVVGSGLSLTAGVLSATAQSAVGGPIQPVGTATITGTATTASPSNHQHPLSPAVAGTGLSLTAGVLSVTTLVPVSGEEITAVGTNTATGTTTTFARTNHGHALNPSVVGTGLSLNAGVINGPLAGSLIQAVGTNTQTGTSTGFARENHVHILSPAIVGNDLSLAAGVLSVNPRVPVVGSLPTVITTQTVTGTATQYAPANHGHVLGAVVAGNDITVTDGTINVSPRVPVSQGLIQAVGTATITGTATTYAVGNHQHPLSPAIVGAGLALTAGVLSVTGGTVAYGDGASDITAVSTATSTGTTTTVARANHVHTLNPAVAGTGLTLTAGVLAANVRAMNYVTCTATTTQVYTVPSGVKALLVEVVAGGGGGGGSTGATSQGGAGGGGASGGFARKFITATATAYTYIVGAKGLGGSAGANDGVAGTNSTFGAGASLITAKGGGGGLQGASAATLNAARGGNHGGISTGGDINANGAPGGNGIASGVLIALGGQGGNSVYGGGAWTASGNNDAEAGTAPGAGGGGGSTLNSGTSRAGGNGVDGLITIQEFYGS